MNNWWIVGHGFPNLLSPIDHKIKKPASFLGDLINMAAFESYDIYNLIFLRPTDRFL